jgi:drug/metabolite transporter (DMT)-like permease
MTKYQPLTVMFFVFLFGFFFVFPFGYHQLTSINIDLFTNDIYLKVLFVVVCTTFIAYLFNAFALKTLSPSVVSIYIYLQPVLASVIAIIYNSDSIDYIKILSSFFIFTAVFLVSIPSKKVITN